MPKKKFKDPYDILGTGKKTRKSHLSSKRDKKPLSLNLRQEFYSNSVSADTSEVESSDQEEYKLFRENKRMHTSTMDESYDRKIRPLSTKKRKLIRESTIQELKRPPKARLKKGNNSTRHHSSVNAMKRTKALKKKSMRVLKNPDIVKLAPFSTSLVTGKKTKCAHTPVLTPNRPSFGNPSCLKNIAERKTILKEIQKLSEALLTQQGKFEVALDRIKEEKRKHNKTRRNLEKSELKKDHIEYLKRRIEDLKRNEENLLQDLVQQQAISKDALQGLDNLRVKFDEEKKIMKDELENYYTLLIDQEKEKYNLLVERTRHLEGVETQVKELENKNTGLDRRNHEQRDTLHSLQSMLEEARKRSKEFEDKYEDKNAQLDLKETQFNTVVAELKQQLAELEERTHEKYQTQIQGLEEENKIKEEELNMKAKEIDILHNNFEKKFAQFEQRNEELESQIEFKEREFVEEKFRREEVESELKRTKEEMEDLQMKESVGAKFGFKDSYLANAQMPVMEILEKTESTYCIDSKNQSNENEYDSIYGKLTSELTNLRNEINNLKSDRGSSRKIQGQPKGVLEYPEEENYTNYYKKNFNNEPRRVLSKRPLHCDSGQNQLKMRVSNPSYSEIDKLNALENKLNRNGDLDEALRSDTEEGALSYRQSDLENINSEVDGQFYGQSENQSPNEDFFKRQQINGDEKQVYWDITNDMEPHEMEEQMKSMVPSLNMEKINPQYS